VGKDSLTTTREGTTMDDLEMRSTWRYRFEVRALSGRPVSEAVESIAKLAPQMAADLAAPDDTIGMTVNREKTIPLDPVTILILIEVVNLTARPLLEGFFNRLGEKIADYLTERVDNVAIEHKSPVSGNLGADAPSDGN
jgi:hypothetical protein